MIGGFAPSTKPMARAGEYSVVCRYVVLLVTVKAV